MANPLLTLMAMRPPEDPRAAQRRAALRRVAVKVPSDGPTTDAIFLAFRRMRGPLIVMLVTFAVSILGLTLIPGVDDQGKPYRLTFFDAFYFISYTATTIGFGETPYAFTIAQRMWVSFAIYASVIGWASAISALFALVNCPTMSVWTLVGSLLRNWLDDARRLRAFNIGMALLLVASLYPILADTGLF